MASLTPSDSWDNVYQIETTDPVQGGAGGVTNTPHQNNTNRTERIKETLNLVGIDVENKLINKNRIEYVDSLAELQALTGMGEDDVIYISGRTSVNDGGQGKFVWLVGDFTTQVTSDTRSGVYAPSDADPTGADGCWVRQLDRYDIRYWGAKPDFSYITYTGTDNSSAIQAAINCINLTGENRVLYIPTGSFMINTSLDLSSTLVSLKGESSAFTDSVIVGNTGDDFALDFTKSESRWLSVEDISVRSFAGQTNPTKNGVLFARTVAANLVGENFYKNFRVRLLSDTSANNGFGTIAVASIGAESNTFIGIYFSADVPLFSSSVNLITEFVAGSESTIHTIESLYQTITTDSSSNTENYINGSLVSTSGVRPALQVRNGAVWTCDLFISRLTTPTETTTTSIPAVLFGNCVSMSLRADVEGYKSVIGLYGFNRDHTIDIYRSYTSGYPLIISELSITGTINTLHNSTVNISPTYGTRTVDAEFIYNPNIIQITGCDIKLHCPLDITSEVNSRITGTTIYNNSNNIITTNAPTSGAISSSYIEITDGAVKKVGIAGSARYGSNYHYADYGFYVSTLVLPGTPNRDTPSFLAMENQDKITSIVEIYGQRGNDQFYAKIIYMFQRSSSASAYTLSGSSTLESYDPPSALTDLTFLPVVDSSIGDPLSYHINITLSTGTGITYINGQVKNISRY